MTRTAASLRRALAGAAGRRVAALVVITALGASAGVPVAPVDAHGPVEGTFSPTSESLLVDLQNEARAAAGLPVLDVDPSLGAIARWRSRDMTERRYFAHEIPGPGVDHDVFGAMQHAYGYCFHLAGENLGEATWTGATEEEATAYIFGLFMDSPGHRADILGATWDAMAVGAYRSTGDRYVWTALFAERCDSGTAE
jgi:uncharacterized protein YkwD